MNQKIDSQGLVELTPNQVAEAKDQFADMNAYFAKVKLGASMPMDQIEIGMPCTLYVGSDRYTFEVVSMSGKTVEISRKGHQIERVRLDKKGKWRTIGSKMGVCFNHSDEYTDPSF